MKHQFNAVRWSVWIGMAELAVTVASFSLLAYDLFPSCSCTMETIVEISTFPASWAAGGLWEFYGAFSGRWAPIAFFAVLILNANVWGVIGGCLAGVPGWSYRTFWQEPEHPVACDEAALKRSLRRMLTRHAIYLSVLLLYLHLASVWFCCMFSSMGGETPRPVAHSLRQLISLRPGIVSVHSTHVSAAALSRWQGVSAPVCSKRRSGGRMVVAISHNGDVRRVPFPDLCVLSPVLQYGQIFVN